MAELFFRFDALPIDHSHGNLCAWRGVLELYEITSERAYLERAAAKWSQAMAGGYVWSLGGIGEHWAIFFEGDEGCSESDWLRFNLELWRFTGEARYLDLAERLLHNQYLANQAPNGGFGMRHFDGDAAGPAATRGSVDEWPFCCSFHGPLGLHFLKAYLAAGSESGIFINFPVTFASKIRSAGRDWKLSARARSEDAPSRSLTLEIELAPAGEAGPARAALRVRRPGWAREASAEAAGLALPAQEAGGYLAIERAFHAGETVRVRFAAPLRAEDRRFREVKISGGALTRLRDACLALGPDLLACLPSPPAGRPAILARIDAAGRLDLLGRSAGGLATVLLPSVEASEVEALAALESGRPAVLRPLADAHTRRRAAFVHDLVVLPAEKTPPDALERLAARAAAAAPPPGPCFGEDLEKLPERWIGAMGWEFTPEGLRVAGGDVGLLDGEGYEDYRFEFEMVLPPRGQGITGFAVRAQGEGTGECLMFQIQSADSTFEAKEFKTRPNTLRPHVRRGGAWEIADPVPLPREVHRGEAHRIAIECRGDRVAVFLDGALIYTGSAAGLRSGPPGFRAAGPAEEGIFRKISLRRL